MSELVEAAVEAEIEEKWVDPDYFRPPGADGPYWIYDHRIGTIYVLVHLDGEWHDETGTCKGREVVQGPILPPTREQMEDQPRHFERQRKIAFAEWDFDPLWPVEELPCAMKRRLPPPPPPPPKRTRRKKSEPEPQPEVQAEVPEYEPPYALIGGYYWIKKTADSEPTVALMNEGHWIGLDPETWYHTELTEYPIVLYGPLVTPSKAMLHQRTSRTVLN